jgi:hypothetical protein
MAESRYAHEREALEFLREELPDSELTLVYSNFEFIADDGTVNEVDALVVTRAGMFLLELKSRGGIVKGNRHVWDWGKEGHVMALDSPLINANAKARKLASMIGRQRAFAKDRKPWMEALVFLSDPQADLHSPPAGESTGDSGRAHPGRVLRQQQFPPHGIRQVDGPPHRTGHR